MQRLIRTAAVIALSLVLAGCGESELYTGLTEHEANEMIAVIDQAGLHAEKTTKDGKTWTLLVAQNKFPQTISLLEAQGYPRDQFQTLGDIFKKDGFVSSPVEEHARLVYGLSQELSSTISAMDGVIYARVQIALPQADPLSDTQKASSAAVFIKYDPQVDVESQIGSIKSLVVNSIEGLPYDRVSVMLSPARGLEPTVHAGPETPSKSPASVASLSGVLGAGLGIVGLGMLIAGRRKQRSSP